MNPPPKNKKNFFSFIWLLSQFDQLWEQAVPCQDSKDIQKDEKL
jgi:hypothetical protein